jgi:ATP-dependent 26S proteasome regulatory subunit
MITNPKVFAHFGGDFMPGILFSGKPGTGKSLSARVLGNIAVKRGVTVYNVDNAKLIGIVPGSAPAKIRDLFRRARKKRRVLLMFDEVEAFTRSRRLTQSGVEEEKSDALVALITEIDGVQKYVAQMNHTSSIVVLLMSNRPDLIDDALLRSGRVGIHINFSIPNTVEGRFEILKIHSNGEASAPG